MKMTNKATNFDTQTQKAKLKAIKQIVKIVLEEGWHYEDWRYASRMIREKASLYPARKAQKLPPYPLRGALQEVLFRDRES
jgi:hypothetical protein